MKNQPQTTTERFGQAVRSQLIVFKG